MARTRVLVVDDHHLVRRGVVDAISSSEELEVVGEASDGEQGKTWAKELVPDVIVMDLNMPNVDGVEATRHIHAEFPDIRIMMFTVSEKEDDLFSAMQAGARGYILKDASADELVSAIMHIAQGGVLVSPTMEGTLLAQLSGPGKGPSFEVDTAVSPREKEVLELLAEGATNKEIAADLFISENTVKTHLRNIMDKLHFAKRSQAAAYAIRAGIQRTGNQPRNDQHR